MPYFIGLGANGVVTTQANVVTSTALVAVGGMSFTLEALKKYTFEANLFTTATATAGVRAGLGGTVTAGSVIYEGITFNGGAIVTQTRATALGTAVGGNTTATTAMIMIRGEITVTANGAGTLSVQFAQNAATSTSSVLVGSYFTVLERE